MIRTQNTTMLKRYFIGTQVFLTAAPLIFMMGMAYRSELGQGMSGISGTSAVALLAVMLNPFAAYLLAGVRQNTEQGQYPAAAAGIGGLILVELVALNGFFAMLLAVLLYQVVRFSGLRGAELIRRLRPAELVRAVYGSFLLLLPAALCLFAQVRLMAER